VNGTAVTAYPFEYATPRGTSVIFEAVPEAGYYFVEWSGEYTGNENPAGIKKVIGNSFVTAYFAPRNTEFTSDDGNLSITIPEETTALEEGGEPLTSVEFAVVEPPLLPEQASLIGLAYDLSPEGATFSPPVTINWNYDPADIPAGLAEADLVIVRYDEETGNWEELLTEANWEADAISASLDHFSTVALLGYKSSPPPTQALSPANFTINSLNISPAEANAGEVVSISALLTNTGDEEGSHSITLAINGTIEETREVTLAGGASETVIFTTVPDEAGTYIINVGSLSESVTVRETESAIGAETETPAAKPAWWLNGGILAAIGVSIAVPLAVRRHQKKHQG
jgi:hypothetical protein